LRLKQEKEDADRVAVAAAAEVANTAVVFTVVKEEGDDKTTLEFKAINSTTVMQLKQHLFEEHDDVPPPDKIRIKTEIASSTCPDKQHLGSLGCTTIRACYNQGARAEYEAFEAQRATILEEQKKRRQEVDERIRDTHLKHNRDKVRCTFYSEGSSDPSFSLDDQAINGGTTLREMKQGFLGMNDTFGKAIVARVPPIATWRVTVKNAVDVSHTSASTVYGPEVNLEEDEQLGMCPEFESGCVLTIRFQAPVADPEEIQATVGAVP